MSDVRAGADRIRLEHPPLKGEGRTTESGPGWGGGVAAHDDGAAYVEARSPPPGPLTRADLPPPGGGERQPVAWRDSSLGAKS